MSGAACIDCEQVRQHHWWGGYSGSCIECSARAIARSPAAHEAWAIKGDVQPLRDMVSKVLPNVPKDEAKRLVWGWWQFDRQHVQEEMQA